jgi:hypothetical protein
MDDRSERNFPDRMRLILLGVITPLERHPSIAVVANRAGR